MARNMYGATSADFTLTAGGRVIPGAVLTLWSARTGGTQITDLLDVDSVATTTVTSDASGAVVYYGPNNDKTVHWADSGQGSRVAIRPVDITGDPPVMSIGTVGTGTAAASLTGTSEAPVLNLTLPTAGANGVNTAAIQDGAVTSAKIADGTITSTDVAASTFAAFGTVGNLLTANQAKPTTPTGYLLNSCTEGASGLYTAADATPFSCRTDVSALTAGEIMTVRSAVTTVGRTAFVGIQFYDGAWSPVGGFLAGSVVAAGSSGVSLLTMTVPSGAPNARLYTIYTGSGSAGDTVTLTNATFHKGAAGTFALPGVPVTGQSPIATNGAVHLSGTGSPEGVVTAAPGSTWLQTDSTTDYRGFMVWRKNSGTGNTGWGVETGDTGIRAVTTMGANYTGTFWVRREGQTVVCSFIATATGAGGYDALFTVPSGFRHAQQRIYGACKNTTADKSVIVQADSATNNVIVQATVAASDILVGTLTWHAAVATWPSSLPGSAA